MLRALYRVKSPTHLGINDYIQQTMPQPFKETFPNTRVIIDCTELLIEMPTSFRSQSATFSSYKNHNTAKGLLGISPARYPTFVSEKIWVICSYLTLFYPPLIINVNQNEISNNYF